MAQSPPIRLPLVATPSNRGSSADKDAKLKNGFIEKTPLGDVWCYKRPGLQQIFQPVPGAIGGGLYYKENYEYAIFDGSLYENGIVRGSVTPATGSQIYYFAGSQGATPLLFFQRYDVAYTTNGTTVTQVTDPDYPATTVPGVVYIDGTTYVMTPDCYIYGSAINNPTSWDPLNVIRAQIDPGRGIAIAKQQNYLIAFKEFSVEVFYDAAAAAGSPLGRIEAAYISVGCAAGRTVAAIDGVLLWVGASRSGHRNVMMMEGLKAQVVSTGAVERLLEDAVLDNACTIHVAGHRFYLLNGTISGQPRTLVYDLGEGLWYEWLSSSGTGAIDFTTSSTNSQGWPVIQGKTSGANYKFDIDVFDDFGTAFSWDLVTPNYDGGNRIRKMVNLLEITGDQQTGQLIQIRVSDDDYQTWSQPRTADLGLDRCVLADWGSFRKRAHWFHYKGNSPLRLKAVDLHVDMGVL